MRIGARKASFEQVGLRAAGGGAQISEFAVSLFFLFAFVVLPLINLCVIPLRWSLGKSTVSSRVHQLAQSETLSQAFKGEQEGGGLKDGAHEKLNNIGGITVKSSQLSLIIESEKLQGQTKVITQVGSIAKDWLPDGPLGPYIYRLDLQVDSDVAPLVVVPLPNPKIPGLTAPFAVQFHDTSVWENTGRDPVSGEFFVNE
jgi:hypothetical protein